MHVLDTLVARGFVQQSTGLDALRAHLDAGPVTFYVGFDPTARSLHAGHLVPIQAMGWLQRAGHRAIAVVGGGTGMVGDPSGRTELRQVLSKEDIDANKAALRTQLSSFLSFEPGKGLMVDNADWLLGLGYIEFLRDIGRHFSVNRMLAAESYKIRLEKGLSFIEFNYQLLQAYDFLELFRRHGCTLQLGGDDQWGNILAGTELIRRVEAKDSHALTQPLIMTSAGAKMGKTAAGAVWLDAELKKPFDWYQYWVSCDDRDVGRFLKLYTEVPLDEIAALESLPGEQINRAKERLAWETTAKVHGVDAANQAQAGAQAMKAGAATDDLPTLVVEGGNRYADVLVAAGFATSLSDARRHVKGGAVRLDHDKIADADAPVAVPAGGAVLRLGKGKAVRLLPG
jgi:tyrosyl-tRNA synthetase